MENIQAQNKKPNSEDVQVKHQHTESTTAPEQSPSTKQTQQLDEKESKHDVDFTQKSADQMSIENDTCTKSTTDESNHDIEKLTQQKDDTQQSVECMKDKTDHNFENSAQPKEHSVHQESTEKNTSTIPTKEDNEQSVENSAQPKMCNQEPKEIEQNGSDKETDIQQGHKDKGLEEHVSAKHQLRQPEKPYTEPVEKGAQPNDLETPIVDSTHLSEQACQPEQNKSLATEDKKYTCPERTETANDTVEFEEKSKNELLEANKENFQDKLQSTVEADKDEHVPETEAISTTDSNENKGNSTKEAIHTEATVQDAKPSEDSLPATEARTRLLTNDFDDFEFIDEAAQDEDYDSEVMEPSKSLTEEKHPLRDADKAEPPGNVPTEETEPRQVTPEKTDDDKTFKQDPATAETMETNKLEESKQTDAREHSAGITEGTVDNEIQPSKSRETKLNDHCNTTSKQERETVPSREQGSSNTIKTAKEITKVQLEVQNPIEPSFDQQLQESTVKGKTQTAELIHQKQLTVEVQTKAKPPVMPKSWKSQTRQEQSPKEHNPQSQQQQVDSYEASEIEILEDLKRQVEQKQRMINQRIAEIKKKTAEQPAREILTTQLHNMPGNVSLSIKPLREILIVSIILVCMMCNILVTSEETHRRIT